MEYPVLISKKLLARQNLMETLKFAYAVDPTAFVKAFNDAGIGIDSNNIDNELASLFKLSLSQGDINGKVTKKDGTPVKFNVLSVLYNMDINHELLNRQATTNRDSEFITINKPA